MVKTRNSSQKVLNVFEAVHKRFGKNMTHRLYVETIDNEKNVTSRSNTDTTFFGEIQEGMDIDRRLIEAGWVELGDAILYVSAKESESSNFNPGKSVIIEGSSAGTYEAWEITKRIDKQEWKDTTIAYVFKLSKIPQQTIS